jgi:hypothetical protein
MQWNALIGFIDTFYLDLVAKCKFDSRKAWKLVARCVAAVFEATQIHSSKVILLEDSTKLGQKAAFVWATFQTHRVIQSFIDVQFQSHSKIVTEISLFMVRERVDPQEIELLASKCKKAEEGTIKATAELKKLQESQGDLKRKHDALSSEFKLLKAKEADKRCEDSRRESSTLARQEHAVVASWLETNFVLGFPMSGF